MSAFAPATRQDLEVVASQLGREPRGVIGIGARCQCGAPVVVVTSPRLSDGTPFPTLFYLTHPEATREASRLEAAGKMADYALRLQESPDDQERYQRAHESYVHSRETIEVVDEIRDISAGGMPYRVKCLHALIADRLVRGVGVNPVGDWAYDDSAWRAEVCQCVDE